MSADIVPIRPLEAPKPARSKPKQDALTVKRIEALKPAQALYSVRDGDVAGLVVRVSQAGNKVFYLETRIGARRKNIKLGAYPAMSLADARKAAKEMLADIGRGIDPTGAKADTVSLGALIDAYEADLTRRKAVRTKDVISSLRRGLKRFQKVPASDLTRADIVRAIDKIADTGKVGAAGYLRKNVTPCLNYGVTAGLISSNVMAGYRTPRRTRAEKLAEGDRLLTLMGDAELALFWTASETLTPLYRDFLRFCLVTGQRREETAAMRWSDIKGDLWVIPAEINKMGEAQTVPLGPLAREIIHSQPRRAGSPYVFSARGDGMISNHSRRIVPMKDALEVAALEASDIYPDADHRKKRAAQMRKIGAHALRRSYRTGLSEIGISEPLAELMIGHNRADLVARYDKSERLDMRRDAQARWEDHLADVVSG